MFPARSTQNRCTLKPDGCSKVRLSSPLYYPLGGLKSIINAAKIIKKVKMSIDILQKLQ